MILCSHQDCSMYIIYRLFGWIFQICDRSDVEPAEYYLSHYHILCQIEWNKKPSGTNPFPLLWIEILSASHYYEQNVHTITSTRYVRSARKEFEWKRTPASLYCAIVRHRCVLHAVSRNDSHSFNPKSGSYIDNNARVHAVYSYTTMSYCIHNSHHVEWFRTKEIEEGLIKLDTLQWRHSIGRNMFSHSFHAPQWAFFVLVICVYISALRLNGIHSAAILRPASAIFCNFVYYVHTAHSYFCVHFIWWLWLRADVRRELLISLTKILCVTSCTIRTVSDLFWVCIECTICVDLIIQFTFFYHSRAKIKDRKLDLCDPKLSAIVRSLDSIHASDKQAQSYLPVWKRKILLRTTLLSFENTNEWLSRSRDDKALEKNSE